MIFEIHTYDPQIWKELFCFLTRQVGIEEVKLIIL